MRLPVSFDGGWWAGAEGGAEQSFEIKGASGCHSGDASPTCGCCPAPEPPVDPLGRTTPYGCVVGFLQAVNSDNLSKAVPYLDTKLPEEKAEQLALQLKAVLDAGLSLGR